MSTCGSLFSGIGLLDYGLHLAGWEHRWFCEADEWRRGILARRWPGVPALDDVRRAGRGTLEPVVLVAGGFPCKGGSTAGKRTGLDHPETALWREMARVVRELRPRYVLIENVANLLAIHDGAVWGTVLGDLAACGYDAEWDCLPAAAFGAPHLRDRVFCVATDAEGPDGQGPRAERATLGGAPADANGPTSDAQRNGVRQQSEPEPECGSPPLVAGPAEAPADPGGAGRQERDRAFAGGAQHAGSVHGASVATHPYGGSAQSAGGERRRESEGAGVPLGVEWREYEPAIQRWERALGRPAGEPLVQGVVTRGARGLVRSRLSALGDGVQVQAGYFMGRLLMERAEA